MSKRRKSRTLHVTGRIVIGLAILFVLAAGILPALGENLVDIPPPMRQSQLQQSYSSYSPILINGDAGFRQQNSGVTGGTGSASNPYVISGWGINMSIYTMGLAVPPSNSGIAIENTRAHFVIRNVSVFDGITNVGPYHFFGIRLSNVTNGIVSDSLLKSDLYGVDMLDSSQNIITGNQLVSNANGISVISSSHNTFSYNSVYFSLGSYFNAPTIGFDLTDSSHNTLVYNDVTGQPAYGFELQITLGGITTGNYLAYNTVHDVAGLADYGFQLAMASGNTIVSNKVINTSGEGFFVQQSDNVVLEGNYAIDNTLAGIRVEQSSHDIITGNVASGSTGTGTISPDQVLSWGAGIGLFFSSYDTVSSNEVYNNAAGIALSETTHSQFSDNLSHQNTEGFTIFDGSNLDVFSHNHSYRNVGAGFYFDVFNSASDSDTFATNIVDHNHVGFYVTDLYPGITEPPTNHTLVGNIIFANNLPSTIFLPTPNSDGVYIDGSLGSNVTSNLIFNNPVGLEWGQTLANGRNFVYNNFFSNPTNVFDPSQNVGGSTPNNFPRNLYNITGRPGGNIIGGTFIGGNFWSDYSLSYVNGLETNTPYMPGLDRSFCSFGGFCLYQGGDYLPLLVGPPLGDASSDIHVFTLGNPSLTIEEGSNGLLPIAITSWNGFTGTVQLPSSSTGSAGLPIVNFNPSSLTLTAAGTLVSVMNVTNTIAPGTYSVTIPVQGSTKHILTIQLIVNSPPLVSVVRGLDSGISSSTFSDGWSNWQLMSGSTASAPVICSSDQGRVDIIVRGSDNVSIFHRSYSNGVWSAWDSPSGGTDEQPACASQGGLLNVVLRGTHNEIWYNYRNDTTGIWGTWQNLGGIAFGPPILVASPSGARLDLIVQGEDYSLWHRSFVNGQWSSAWDSMFGGTPSPPTAVTDGRSLHVVARGTHNEIWYNALNFTTSLWSGWIMLDGATQQTPTLAIDASGNLHLFVIGINNGIYHKIKPYVGTWSSGWDSPGGATIYPVAVVAQGLDVHIIVIGMDNRIDSNTLAGTSWLGWSGLGGETLSIPGLAAL